jgi:hypothetical protein
MNHSLGRANDPKGDPSPLSLIRNPALELRALFLFSALLFDGEPDASLTAN